MDKVRATVGIDPGTKGAMALVPREGEPLVMDWATPQAMGWRGLWRKGDGKDVVLCYSFVCESLCDEF